MRTLYRDLSSGVIKQTTPPPPPPPVFFLLWLFNMRKCRASRIWQVLINKENGSVAHLYENMRWWFYRAPSFTVRLCPCGRTAQTLWSHAAITRGGGLCTCRHVRTVMRAYKRMNTKQQQKNKRKCAPGELSGQVYRIRKHRRIVKCQAQCNMFCNICIALNWIIYKKTRVLIIERTPSAFFVIIFFFSSLSDFSQMVMSGEYSSISVNFCESIFMLLQICLLCVFSLFHFILFAVMDSILGRIKKKKK